MGKKSKGKAPKPAAAAAAPSGAGAKKQRCVSCCALLKDLAKAHECPGCSPLTDMLFCWRCEKKVFEECPNGSACVHPVKRCNVCSGGKNFRTVISNYVDEKGNPPREEHWSDFFLQLCELEGKHNLEAMPLQQCGADGCPVKECYRCLADPNSSKMISCSVCSVIRCWKCIEMTHDSAGREYIASLADSGVPVTESDIATAAAMLREAEPETIGQCKDCGIGYCLSCTDDTSIEYLVQCILYGLRNENKSKGFRCSQCYWASKPCINPNCPSEVGIPTKRCGGCHLDRYCSVECQAVMYPDHVGKCKKIQEKRTAAGKE